MKSKNIGFKLPVVFCLIATLFLITGCSTTNGGLHTNTHFAFPNSNVTPLGRVSASMEKTSFLLLPKITIEDVNILLENAIAQKAGADLLINYSVDTKFTKWVILPIYTMKTTIVGEAASMEVGEQGLKEYLKQIEY